MKATILALAALLSQASAFSPTSAGTACRFNAVDAASSTCLFGTNRRARRKTKQTQGNSRPNSFYDAINDVDDEDGKVKKKKKVPDEPKKESVVSSASVTDAVSMDDQRPSVSTIVLDEQTGIERIQQGRYVMDVATRKAVQLSDLGPMYRMAQMFPGVAPDIREKHRLDWNTVEVPEIIEKLRQACLTTVKDEETGEESIDIPPHPRVTDEALDFVTANRDLLGPRMTKTLGRLKLRAQSQMDKEEALQMRKLWKHFMTVDESITAAFRQMLMDAEGNVGPNFGNLDLMSFCNGHLYERTANYLVLKGMVAHWEKKVRDAEYVENTPETRSNFMEVLMVGDPKRYLPDPPIIFRFDEVVRITLMAQNMTAQFVATPQLYDDLPPEVRFVEAASSIKGGTALRKFMVEDFCPAEEITPDALREGLRRLDIQLGNMQIDPYGDLKNVVNRLCEAVSVGTDDERDPYIPYLNNLDQNGPGFFETYTFNHDRQSLVRFLDSAKEIQQGGIGPTGNLLDQLSNEASNLFGFGKAKPQVREKASKEEQEYSAPQKRACGRPHNVGWLDLLGDEEMNGGSSGDPEDEVYESDNWREIISNRQRIGGPQ
mmetsp:Transcript_15686/g.22973  ORF Transcript_15686/g.22973 Transcript_15686/m.22973 type:complete len:602 (+) Transcript_15686:1-1806(+)